MVQNDIITGASVRIKRISSAVWEAFRQLCFQLNGKWEENVLCFISCSCPAFYKTKIGFIKLKFTQLYCLIIIIKYIVSLD